MLFDNMLSDHMMPSCFHFIGIFIQYNTVYLQRTPLKYIVLFSFVPGRVEKKLEIDLPL
jgi:hypothetical protein